MAIDSSILPLVGTWQGIGYSNRISDMISGTSEFIQTNEGRQSRYNANCYTSYIGEDGLLGNKSIFLTTENNTITLTPDLSAPKPANICLYLNDYEEVVQDINQKATNSAYIDYVRPVISFDPKTICIVPFARIAQHDGDTEGLIWSTVGFNNLMNDEVYAGIMENGYTADQSRILAGWGIRFYIGSSTSRSFTNRLIVCAETAPPMSEEQQLSNWYSVLTNSDIRQNGMRLLSGTITDVRDTDVYRVNNGLRRYDSSTVASENVQGLSFTAPYTLNKNELQGNTMKIIEGTSMFYVWGRYGYEPIIYRYISGNDVLKAVAATGLFFSPYTSIAESANLAVVTDNDVYLGIMNSEGYTTGEYVRGADCMNQRQVSWSEAVADAEAAGYIPLDPSQIIPGIDPNDYDEDLQSILPDPTTDYIAHAGDIYCMQHGKVQTLLNYLNNVSANLQNDLETTQKFLTINPIDVISGLMYYPFNIPDFIAGTDIDPIEQIRLANNLAEDSGAPITARKLSKSTCVINAGSCTYYAPYGLDDFRSYEPYSRAELYIPYCGSVNISPAEYIGHEISVKYLIDLLTGACIALIYRDALILDTIPGTIGVSIPITALQTASIQAAQKQSQEKLKLSALSAGAAVVGIGAAAFTGGMSLALAGAAVGAVGSAAALSNAQYEVEHQQVNPKSVGTASPSTSMCNEQQVRLVIHRPVMLPDYDSSIYSHTVGNACCISANLAAFSGFTQISAADLSGIPASAAEKNKLMQLLQAGVFL